ncbi:MAG: autotransporter-associated beta strand repeat-containing protein, partial [Candidatus Thiodiazotropha sp.]
MAATYTWDGGAGTSSWSDVANWDPDGFPSASVSCGSCYDLLIFNDPAGGTLSNNVGWAYQLQFGSSAGSYNLGGPQSMESRGIDNQSSNLQTISMGGVHVYYGAIWDAGSGGLTVSSTVTLEPGLDGLTITGSADTLLSGNISTVIRPGLTSVVTKNGTGTLSLGGSGDEYFQLQIDEGSVSIDSSSWNGAAVTLSSGASLNINTANAYVGNISGSAGQVSLGNSALTITRNASATFAGTITGFGGSLNKTGSGTLTLSGNNSYTGGTTFSGGTIAISSINNLGLTGSGLTFDGGTLQTTGSVVGIDRTTTLNSGGGTFNVDNNAVHTSAINGTGSLSKIGDGNLILSGSNSYSGGTTVSAGVLRCGAAGGFVDNTDYTVDGGILDLGGHDLSASALSGTGGVINLGSANLSVNQSSDTSFAGDMRGSGSFSKSGSGALTLSGSNSYSGGTTVSAGTLLGNTSSLQGDITNNANVVFDQTADDTFAGSISGSGSLTKSGSGVLTLTGVNTYSGGTTVSVGTLQGDSGSMQGDITNNARVIFNQGSDGTYSGDMSGSGTLIKSSSGVLTLTGANTFSGGTSVNAGTLYVNGSITSASTISASATLSGSGTLGSVTVNNGGILVPGNTTGELTTGALTLNDTSVLDFELGDPTGTAGVDSDLVSVNGDLTLDGGLNITTLTGFGVGSYRLFNYSGNLT